MRLTANLGGPGVTMCPGPPDSPPTFTSQNSFLWLEFTSRMNKSVSDLLKKATIDWFKKALKHIKVPPQFYWVCAAVLTTSIFVFNPIGKSFISVPGDRIEIALPSFATCSLKFRTPTRVQSYEIVDLNRAVSNQVLKTATRVPVGGLREELIIQNPLVNQRENTTNHVTVFLEPSFRSEVVGFSIENRPLELLAFFKQNLKSAGAEYFRFHYARLVLADLIFRFNDPLSNWVLWFMIVGLAWLVIVLVRLWYYANLLSKTKLRKIAAELAATDTDVVGNYPQQFDILCVHIQNRDRLFHFIQILGPSVGFILTVSSLVAALHPGVRASNDIDKFMGGIHVAMLSTLLGLLVRVVAAWICRVNEQLLERFRECLLFEGADRTSGAEHTSINQDPKPQDYL